jgi:hypothetical protein
MYLCMPAGSLNHAHMHSTCRHAEQGPGQQAEATSTTYGLPRDNIYRLRRYGRAALARHTVIRRLRNVWQPPPMNDGSIDELEVIRRLINAGSFTSPDKQRREQGHWQPPPMNDAPIDELEVIRRLRNAGSFTSSDKQRREQGHWQPPPMNDGSIDELEEESSIYLSVSPSISEPSTTTTKTAATAVEEVAEASPSAPTSAPDPEPTVVVSVAGGRGKPARGAAGFFSCCC